ncbi:MAG: YceI family protein [Bryobacteraceae bacterium]|jgi:polyisoprenoid-binding protein YceI
MIRTYALLLSALALPALAADFDIDSAHSAAQFSVRHLMVSNVRGSFKKLTGKVVFDESNPSATVVQASIDVSTVDTGEPARDTHLKSPDFFDLAKFPTMTFVSRSASRTSQGVDLSGDLTLHGVTKAVVLHVSDITKEIKDPRGMLRIGATATTVINRQDFGMVWNHNLDGGGVVVGNDVTITIDIEVARKAA